ncbi:MAG: hypothetical protein MI799_20805 [Desulfobacterales bacterium]|nr:hypothetical protein [Desulfobacterales bacterium]
MLRQRLSGLATLFLWLTLTTGAAQAASFSYYNGGFSTSAQAGAEVSGANTDFNSAEDSGRSNAVGLAGASSEYSWDNYAHSQVQTGGSVWSNDPGALQFSMISLVEVESEFTDAIDWFGRGQGSVRTNYDGTDGLFYKIAANNPGESIGDRVEVRIYYEGNMDKSRGAFSDIDNFAKLGELSITVNGRSAWVRPEVGLEGYDADEYSYKTKIQGDVITAHIGDIIGVFSDVSSEFGIEGFVDIEDESTMGRAYASHYLELNADAFTTNPVPLPGTFLLLAFGLTSLTAIRRKQNNY